MKPRKKSKHVSVYIEGEGGGGTPAKRKQLSSDFRRSWRVFLQPLVDVADGLDCTFNTVECGSGSAALDTFTNSGTRHPGSLGVLLIDAEGPVADVYKPWAALKQLRMMDRPAWAADDHCYLMVQCLENWLVADRKGLQAYFDRGKPCFSDNKLPAWPDPEKTPKPTVQAALEAATQACGQPYTHAAGNILIGVVDREKLMNLSSVKRLFDLLSQFIIDYANQ